MSKDLWECWEALRSIGATKQTFEEWYADLCDEAYEAWKEKQWEARGL